ncbi:dienelactone hydrolase endo-1,3,1,4-beta-D-glucanase [Leucogyrophana mollusca]|uniref:Dienelactone hydrolase endo-1,3,1,4-beta-D-glucanase n=1 Tax=Leucogyrophana mollusca TaxID=85980 RepID=A0ACB8BK28_9AGAM|nr:dienelactone hydrolase endo-1,3,1,4-beta-D-glucanase [Leucogyrophana mollusca]
MSCADCFKGSLLTGEPTGSITELDGAYLASGPTAGDTRRAVVLLTDAFGLPLKNSKLIADNIAKCLSCDVWAPDIFNGEPILRAASLEPNLLHVRAGGSCMWDKFRLVMILLPRLLSVYRSRPTVADARIRAFLKKLREQKQYEKIGAVGYCYGGGIAVRLGHSKVLDSIVVCHPAPVTADHIKAIDVPASWVCAEEDDTFSAALRNKSEAIFAARKGKEDFVDYEFVDYKGTAHGFACRPNMDFPDVKEGYEKGFQQTIKWFEKTLQSPAPAPE